MNDDGSAWAHAVAVTRPALALAPPDFLDELEARLREAGVQNAVARHDSAPIFDWMAGLLALQGISDAAAFSFDAANGGITFEGIEAALLRGASCSRLGSYWGFSGCGYRKGTGLCAEPRHRPRCPLPRHALRKGLLNQASYSLFLFIRDVCGGDLVGWIDHRLATADPGRTALDRAARMREALLGPLAHVAGTGRKLWSLILANLLLAGDPGRERWVTTGASFVAVDSLVHNHLHRTGILRRLGAEHPYGTACYGPNGCAAVIEGLADRIDARAFNRTSRPAFHASCSTRFGCSARRTDATSATATGSTTGHPAARCSARRHHDASVSRFDPEELAKDKAGQLASRAHTGLSYPGGRGLVGRSLAPQAGQLDK